MENNFKNGFIKYGLKHGYIKPRIKSCNSNSYAFKGRPKKDNSKKTDYFVNCRCCGEYIRGDFRSSFDKRYCQNCL